MGSLLDHSFSSVLSATNLITIATTATTLMVGALALMGTIHTIENQNNIYQQNRLRDLAAARATMPLALRELSLAAKVGIRTASRPSDASRPPYEEIRSDLNVSEDTIETLQKCIRFADDLTSQWLAIIISHYQIYLSRMDSFNPGPPMVDGNGLRNLTNGQIEAIVDWATLHALVDHLFPFARGANSNADRCLDVGRIRSTLFIEDYSLSIDPQINERLKAREATLQDGDIDKFRHYI
ncbi:MAG: hypothetical protein GC186_10185 [Rhodobacteraceae bacterium]|nr:hypothetical protein [Paracoccaceae bacterium]